MAPSSFFGPVVGEARTPPPFTLNLSVNLGFCTAGPSARTCDDEEPDDREETPLGREGVGFLGGLRKGRGCGLGFVVAVGVESSCLVKGVGVGLEVEVEGFERFNFG